MNLSDWLPGVIAIASSGVVSLVVSHFTSKKTLKSELAKMGYQHRRDDVVQLRSAYTNMHSAVLCFISRATPGNKQEALSSLSAFISISPVSLRNDVHRLQDHILSTQPYQGNLNPRDIQTLRNILNDVDTKWTALSNLQDESHGQKHK